jgi:hypothetical protein
MLVLAGQEAVVAALAEGHVDDEMRFLHVLFQSSPGAMAGVLLAVPRQLNYLPVGSLAEGEGDEKQHL